ncbi:MAG: hypothetical protein ABUK01_14890 [Leptospirales bacterium]
MDSTGYKDYNYLVDEYGEEYILERFELLLDKSESSLSAYCNSLSKDLLQYFCINEHTLLDVVINYFADITRLKKFHGIKKVNSVKIAAYTGYWLAKIKPIQIKDNVPDDISDEYRLLFTKINEKVALNISFGMAFDNSKPTNGGSNLTELYKSIVYSLAYRISTPQALELMIQAHISTPLNPVLDMLD